MSTDTRLLSVPMLTPAMDWPAVPADHTTLPSADLSMRSPDAVS
jgi:hypothetical protein